MEIIDSIFYRQVNPSDFKIMYNINKPASGGGQTYIDAAGIPERLIESFLEHGSKIPSTLEGESRYVYTIDAYVIGKDEKAEIEFAPRKDRANYKISRQNIKNRHPSWSKENGFPVPNKNEKGNYIEGFSGIIDNLITYIIRTKDSDTNNYKYYAGFLNAPDIPETWPKIDELSNMVKGDKRGVLSLERYNIIFNNDESNPFIADELIDEIVDLSDIVEAIEDYIDIDAKANKAAINEVSAPKSTGAKTKEGKAAKRVAKKVDYAKKQKKATVIGDVGEIIAMEIERRRLEGLERPDLAAKIERVSETAGDGLGYDIKSFDTIDGEWKDIYIEVKATTGGIEAPFEISRNEVEFSVENEEQFYIYRIFGISNDLLTINYYRINGAVPSNFELQPSSFIAYPKNQ